MKKSIYYVLAFLLLIFSFSGCFRKCKNSNCGANSYCDEKDGSCICNSGYEKNASGECVPEDPCKNITCDANEECVNGTCKCVAGYISNGFGGCVPDPCYNVNCVNGNCINGNCNCYSGYELGPTQVCDVEVRAKFLGTWSGTESCNAPGSPTHTIVITADPSSIDKVKISNYSNYTCAGQPLVATARVSGNYLVDIEAYCSNYNLSNASGVMNGGGQLVLNYRKTLGGFYYDCSTTYNK